ncbi:MAG: curli assembly protein CsgF [Calditrichia bacterium]
MLRVFLILLLISLPLMASELVYVPLNPSFGGSYLNASWLMQQAEAQNTFTGPSSSYRGYSRDPLEDFKESLNRSILSRFASQLTRNAFGEDMLAPGHYEIGDYIIDVRPGDQGIQVSIYDNSTGSETSIIVPYY